MCPESGQMLPSQTAGPAARVPKSHIFVDLATARRRTTNCSVSSKRTIEMRQSEPRAVLLVEDNHDFCEIYRFLLRPWNLEIVTASSAEAAFARIAERSFALYVIDLQLADTDTGALLAALETQGADTIRKCVVATSFATLAPAFTSLPVVRKTELGSLAPHLRRILGEPSTVAAGACE